MDVVSLGETMVAFEPDRVGKLRSIQNFDKFAGGSETNTLIALQRLGFSTRWVSFLGDDEFGRYILSEVRGEGVDASYVRLVPNQKTGIFFIERSAAEDCNSIYYRENSSMRLLGPEYIDESMLSDAKILHLTGITPCISESCLEATIRIIDIAKNRNIKVIFDPNLRLKIITIERAREILIPLILKCDVVMPNNTELRLLFPDREYKDVANQLLEGGVKMLVVKMGEEGAVAYNKYGTYKVDAFKLGSVASTIGAGDAFNGGFIAGLLEKCDIESCLLKASAMGTFVTRGYDPYRMLPTKKEFEGFITGRREIIR